jgi:flagellar basal body-associated protein FliL
LEIAAAPVGTNVRWGLDMAAESSNPGKPAATPKDDSAAGTGSSSATSSPQGGKLARLVTIKALAALLLLSLVAHGAGLVYSHYAHRQSDVAGEPMEIDLGTYRFEAEPSEQGSILGAKFRVYIALIEDIHPQARQALAQRQFRVKENIEELLRQAHGGDFADPALGELKRQLQERINETLGLRAIDDVIITDLEMFRAPSATKPATTATRSLPWVDEPSS